MSAQPHNTNVTWNEGMRIGGENVQRDEVLEVFNPYTNDVVGTVPRGNVGDVERAFKIAADYKPQLSRYDRQRILMDCAAALVERRNEIAALITAESGLCAKDADYEVGRAFDVFSLAGQLCLHDDSETFSCDLTPHGKKRRIHTLRQPLTAISAITPFNHPLNMVAHKVAPSIATNNCIVLKPTDLTPLTSILLADVLYEVGLPPEMYQIVTGSVADIGDTMISNEHAELVTFTGGVRAGKYIAENAGYRRTVLELGGNDPLIVMDDADIAKAAALAVAGATKNSGQRCTAVKRILAIDSIADALAEAIVAETAKLTCGDPSDPATDVGTVITAEAAALFERRVEMAVAEGAKVLHGAPREDALFHPTVVDHVNASSELVKEETFGPVVPIVRCKDLDDVIQTSNSTAFGLSSGVCTNRIDVVHRCIEELRVGTVNVWEVPGYRIEMSPFGGIKDSGLGYKEGVIEAMKSYTNVKTYSVPWF
ncbi:MAG: phosphonoacetaldehyde dehydrogenase [Gammaproteobacteria bacterium]|nr:phosphonoacetaldehyde dehydrogenase [Gammaproteobacteria bacterium]